MSCGDDPHRQQGAGNEQYNSDRYLFPSFLDDRKVYHLAAAWWRRLLAAIARERELPFRSYLNPNDSQGRKEYDANPICDALFPTLRKPVRVIQDRPARDAPDLAARIDEFELEEGKPIRELVLALALSKETAEAARRLLHRWVVEDASREEMEGVIREMIGDA